MKILLPLVGMLIVAGCIAIDSKRHSIDLDQNDQVSIVDFIDSVSIVLLETNDKSLIGDMSKIIPYNNRYYILDMRLQAILCFENNGKFLFKIDQRGRGPEEYSYLEDFNIDPYNNEIMLLVPFGEILYFNLDGHFLSKVSLPSKTKAYNEVYALNAAELLFISLSEYQAVYYSKKSNTIINELFPNEIPIYFTATDRSFTYNSNIYFNSILKNEVINMSDNKQKVAYYWDFGKKNNTSKQISTFNSYIKQQKNSRSKALYLKDLIGDGKFLNYFIYSSYETNRYRIALLEYKNAIHTVIVDKKDDRNYVFTKTIEGIHFFFRNLHNESVFLYDSDIGQSIYAKNILSQKQLKAIETHNNDNDNPILIIYNLKR